MPTTDGSSAGAEAFEASTASPVEYRTVRLDATQVSAHWPSIGAAIRASLPPGVDAAGFVGPAVFQALVDGQMHAWGVTVLRETPQVCALAVTRWVHDAFTGQRYLTICALYGFEPVPDRGMIGAFEAISRFAASGGAKHATAITDNPQLIGLAERLGCNCAMRYVFWEVKA